MNNLLQIFAPPQGDPLLAKHLPNVQSTGAELPHAARFEQFRKAIVPVGSAGTQRSIDYGTSIGVGYLQSMQSSPACCWR